MTSAEFTLQTLHKRLAANLPQGTLMGEPSPSSLTKAHGQYRFQLLLRSDRIRPLARYIESVIPFVSSPQDIIVTWDVDPMNLG